MGKYKIASIQYLSETYSVERLLDMADKHAKSGMNEYALLLYLKLKQLAEEKGDYYLVDECNKRVRGIQFPMSVCTCLQDTPADEQNIPPQTPMGDNKTSEIFDYKLDQSKIRKALFEIINKEGIKPGKPFWFVVYSFFKYRSWIVKDIVTRFFDWINDNFNAGINGPNKHFQRIPVRFRDNTYPSWSATDGNVDKKYCDWIGMLTEKFTNDIDSDLHDKDGFTLPNKRKVNL